MTQGVREKIRIRLQTDDMSHKAVIAQLAAGFEVAQQGDTMVITYDLNMDYYGDTYQKLSAIEKLLESPTVIGSADMGRLDGGRILLQEIVRKIDRIKDLL